MTHAHPALIVTLVHLPPVLVGLGLGRLLGRIGGRLVRSRIAAALLLLGPPAVVPLAAASMGIGFHDLVVLSALFGAGLLAGRAGRMRIRAREVGLLLVSSVLAVFLAEILARRLLPYLPPYDERGRAVLFVGTGAAFSQARALFPDLYEEPFRSRTERARSPTRRVLVAGDSIVEGEGAGGPAVAFPAVLERLDPRTAWINAGFSGTGPDFYLRVIAAWTPRVKVDEVLLVFYTGNDLSNLDEPWAACAGGPLLRYAAGRAEPRCEQPDTDLPVLARIALSPPPLLLRAATPVSHLARHACLAWTRLAARLLETPQESEQWAHLEAILRTLRDDLAARGIVFRVLLFPFRPAIEDPRAEWSGPIAIGERVIALCRDLGIPVLDATPFFREAAARDDFPNWFVGGRGSQDPHLSPEGHVHFARWWFESLREQRRTPDSGPR